MAVLIKDKIGFSFFLRLTLGTLKVHSAHRSKTIGTCDIPKDVFQRVISIKNRIKIHSIQN